MQYSIFTISRNQDPLHYIAFKAWFTARTNGKRAVPCIGMYKGQSERSFLVNKLDFDEHVRGTEWIAGQESVLHVAGGNKMECYLEYFEDGSIEGLGCMHEVSADEIEGEDAWTYRPDLGKYWIARPGNPDKVLNERSEAYLQGYSHAVQDSHKYAAE